jgi:hypothetical protein
MVGVGASGTSGGGEGGCGGWPRCVTSGARTGSLRTEGVRSGCGASSATRTSMSDRLRFTARASTESQFSGVKWGPIRRTAVRLSAPEASRSRIRGKRRHADTAAILVQAASSERRRARVQYANSDPYPSAAYASGRMSSTARCATSSAVAVRSCAASWGSRARRSRFESEVAEASMFVVMKSVYHGRFQRLRSRVAGRRNDAPKPSASARQVEREPRSGGRGGVVETFATGRAHSNRATRSGTGSETRLQRKKSRRPPRSALAGFHPRIGGVACYPFRNG